MKHRGFLLSEICQVLDCKVHHIRYIEEQLPIISTAYDNRGRKIYSLKDVFLFSRILTLTQNRGLGLKEASDRLLAELEQPSLDRTARFMQVRHELLKARLQSRQAANRMALKSDSSRVSARLHSLHLQSALRGADAGADRAATEFSPLGHFSDDGLLPGDSFSALETELAHFIDHRLSDGIGASERQSLSNGPGNEGRISPASQKSPAHGELDALLSSGTWLVLTPDPYRPHRGYPGSAPATPIRRLPLLEYMAENIIAASNAYGRPPLWVITVRKSHFYELLAFLSDRDFFSLPPSRVVLLPQPDYRDRSSGDAGAVFALEKLLLSQLEDRGYGFGLVYSMEHPLIPLPDEELALRLLSGGQSSLLATLRSGMTGELYFRIRRRDFPEPGKISPGRINTALVSSDTGITDSLALHFPGGIQPRVFRPYRWEFMPPLYGIHRWDSALLAAHMAKTHASWLGLPGGDAEISPLFARDRNELVRRLGARQGRPGLYA